LALALLLLLPLGPKFHAELDPFEALLLLPELPKFHALVLAPLLALLLLEVLFVDPHDHVLLAPPPLALLPEPDALLLVEVEPKFHVEPELALLPLFVALLLLDVPKPPHVELALPELLLLLVVALPRFHALVLVALLVLPELVLPELPHENPPVPEPLVALLLLVVDVDPQGEVVAVVVELLLAVLPQLKPGCVAVLVFEAVVLEAFTVVPELPDVELLLALPVVVLELPKPHELVEFALLLAFAFEFPVLPHENPPVLPELALLPVFPNVEVALLAVLLLLVPQPEPHADEPALVGLVLEAVLEAFGG